MSKEELNEMLNAYKQDKLKLEKQLDIVNVHIDALTKFMEDEEDVYCENEG